MSDDVKHSWHELGERMSALGALMQQRLQAPGEPAPTADHAQGPSSAIASALDQLATAARELGERVGDVAQDDDVRATARETMASLERALRATVDLVTDEVEGVIKPSKHTDD
jgi:hypothetical protein